MRREKLYKIRLNKSLLASSNGLFYTQNKQCIYNSAIFHPIEYNNKYLENCFVLQLRFVCTSFVELSTAHLLKKIQDFILFSSRDIRKIRSLLNICCCIQYGENLHYHIYIVHFEYGKSHQTSQ